MKPLSLKADLTVQQAFDDESHSVQQIAADDLQ